VILDAARTKDLDKTKNNHNEGSTTHGVHPKC